MSTRRRIACTFVFAGTLAFLSGPAFAAVIGKATVTADQAPVMSGKQVISTAKKGDTFDVTEVKGDWFGVAPSQGWIYKDNVRYQGQAVSESRGGSSLPVISGVPAGHASSGSDVVVGVAGCEIFADKALHDSQVKLAPGTKVLVRGSTGDVVEVSTPDGNRGYVRRCNLCDSEELKRRNDRGEVPKNVVCIAGDESGPFVHDGVLSIANNRFVIQAGDAFWLEPSMKGKEFPIGDQKVKGNPDVLILCKADGKLATLPIARIPGEAATPPAAASAGSVTAPPQLGAGAPSLPPAPAWPLTEAQARKWQADAANACGVPVASVLDLGGGVTMKCVLIPAGKFMMGSPASEANRRKDETQHEVMITKPFYMGVHEVTVGQFTAFVNESRYQTEAEKEGWAWAWNVTRWDRVDGTSWRNPGFTQGDMHPVTEVSWNDAAAFCKWMSRKFGCAVRLPTEAEWEYACRAGTTTAYQWGDNPDMGKGWANGADLALKRQIPTGLKTFNWEDGYVLAAPVGSFRSNAFGLCDMHGNVWEWCADWYDKAYYASGASVDPQGPASGQYRIERGGAWIGFPEYCRSAMRHWGSPDSFMTCCGIDGFRVLVEIGSAPVENREDKTNTSAVGGGQRKSR